MEPRCTLPDMDPSSLDAERERPRALPRWLVRLVAVGLGVVALIVLRTLFGLGAAFAYYGKTQDFDSIVAERAVSAETLESWLPDGDSLARDAAFSLGEAEVEGAKEYGGTVVVRISHGDESLVETTVAFTAALDPETFDRRLFSFSPPEIRTREGMRAVVQVSLLDMDEFLGPGATARGCVYIDVVVAAGEGESEFRVVELPSSPASLPDTDERFSRFRMLFGLAHPGNDPPEEGLLYQLRTGFSLTWRKLENGSAWLGIYDAEMRTNGEAYSYSMELEATGGPLSTTRSWNRTYQINDRTW